MEGSYSESECQWFIKILKPSHLTARRLDFPTRFLRILPFRGQRNVRFGVRYGSEARVRPFLCVLRNGLHPKPIISKGWSQLVNDKRLRAGDKLIFFVDVDENKLLCRYRIQVHRARPVKLFGATIGTTWDPLP